MFSAAAHGCRLFVLIENRMIIIIRRVIRLYLIQIFACIAIALAIYFPGLDLALAFLFCLVVGAEAVMFKGDSRKSCLITILIWQAPGLVLSLMSISPAGMWGEANYGFFVLQFWYTPIVPLLSCLSGYAIQGKPIYYYLLLGTPVLMGLYYYLAALLDRGGQVNWPHNHKRSQRT